jgi:polyhydroxyalkanoate synthesis regulator phasin
MLKDLLYLGIGGALLAKEKIEEELQELVEKGKLSKDEVQKIIENAKEKGKEEEEKIKNELKEAIKEVIKELNIATKDDINELKNLLQKDN